MVSKLTHLDPITQALGGAAIRAIPALDDAAKKIVEGTMAKFSHEIANIARTPAGEATHACGNGTFSGIGGSKDLLNKLTASGFLSELSGYFHPTSVVTQGKGRQ